MGYWDGPQNLNDGGGHADSRTLPGFDSRYLARAPGSIPGKNLSPNSVESIGGPSPPEIRMRSNVLRAPVQGSALYLAQSASPWALGYSSTGSVSWAVDLLLGATLALISLRATHYTTS